MARHRIGSLLAVAALVVAGCGGPDEVEPEPEAPAVESPAEPEPTAEPAAPEPEPAADEGPSAFDHYEIASAARDDMAAAIETHGADAVFIATIRDDHPAVTTEAPDADLVALAQHSCDRLDAGLTFDQVYMEAEAEAGIPDDPLALELIGGMIWDIILVSVDTHCPQHADARADWEQSLH